MSISLGYSADGQPVEITLDQLAHHLYVLGKSGMGKTSFLCNMSIDLMETEPNVGLCVIDPLGALVEEIKRRIPDHRATDVILFEARDREHPFALNPFAPEPPAHLLGQWADHVMSIFQLICDDADWNSRTKQTLRNIVITLLSRDSTAGLLGEDWPAALDEVSALLNLQAQEDGNKPPWKMTGPTYRGIFYSSLEESGQIPVLRFWREFYDRVMTLRPKAEVSAAIGGAVDQQQANPLVRNIVGQTQTKINFLDVMNQGKILLVDLSGIGDDSANFLGSVIMAQLASATLQRERYAEPHFYIVADELYRYGNEAFRYISRQGRNFNVHLIAAQQDQTDMRPSQRGLMGNASNRVYFQLVPSDAREQAPEFDATPRPEVIMEPEYRPAMISSEQWIEIGERLRRLARYITALEAWRERGGASLHSLVREEDVRGFINWAGDASGDPVRAFGASDAEVEPGGAVTHSQCNATPEPLPWAKHFVACDGYYDGYLLINGLQAFYTKGGLKEWMDTYRPPAVALDVAKEALASGLRAREWALELPGPFVQHSDEDRTVPVARPAWVDSEGHLGHYIEDKQERGRTSYGKVHRKVRTYSDMEREIVNELTHLPQRYAKCKLAGLDDAPPTEATIKTKPVAAENQRWRENWEAIKKHSRENYARPVAEVEEEVRHRDRVMRRAVETWHSEDGRSREYHANEPNREATDGGPRVQR